MHYPAITGTIYILPSITDTYYSPPAVQLLPHNFLKAAPYILIRPSPYANAKQEHNAEATEENQHHHFSERKPVMSLRSQRVLDTEEPCCCYWFKRKEKQASGVYTLSEKSIEINKLISILMNKNFLASLSFFYLQNHTLDVTSSCLCKAQNIKIFEVSKLKVKAFFK